MRVIGRIRWLRGVLQVEYRAKSKSYLPRARVLVRAAGDADSPCRADLRLAVSGDPRIRGGQETDTAAFGNKRNLSLPQIKTNFQ
jgi:hypothetical protein